MSNKQSANKMPEKTPDNPKQENLPSVQLSLNGEPVYLMEFMASAKFMRESEDMSGQADGTQKADKGAKAKELSVSGMIPFRRHEWLTRLFQLAEATNEKGEQVVYRIANLTAKTVNMREGVFSGEITADEQRVQGWIVNFKLVEQNSVAEKKGKSKQKPTAKNAKSGKGNKGGKPSKAKGKNKSGSSEEAGFNVYLD